MTEGGIRRQREKVESLSLHVLRGGHWNVCTGVAKVVIVDIGCWKLGGNTEAREVLPASPSEMSTLE